MLRDEVPGLVAAWAKTSDLDPAEKKQRLKGLFEDASERAEELAAIFELFAGKFESMVAIRVASRVLKEVRPKLEEIVRESIVVEVPAPVINFPEPLHLPPEPGFIVAIGSQFLGGHRPDDQQGLPATVDRGTASRGRAVRQHS